MKKLNRKGFTLVELLAVIIILAIVVGITIPAITNIINDSKNNAMGVAVDAAADYLTDQYGYMNIDYNTATREFKKAFGLDQTTATYGHGAGDTITAELLREMGLDTTNVKKLTAKLNQTTGNICVTIDEVDKKSEYYSTSYFNSNGTAKASSDTKNSNCVATPSE